MAYEPSGEGGTGVSTKAEPRSLSRTNEPELSGFPRLDDDTSGDHLVGYTSSSGARAIVSGTRRPPTDWLRPRDQSAKLAWRYAISRKLATAFDTAASMETYAATGDLMELSLAGFRLNELLSDLWKLRSEREDDWGDLLNILQGALAQEDFEKFSEGQCYVICTIVADHLGSGTVGIDDVEQSVRLLRNAGFDPWKGISEASQTDE